MKKIKNIYGDEIIKGNRLFYKDYQIYAPLYVHSTVIDVIKIYLKVGSRILDLGAGEGALSVRLKNEKFEVIAAGIEPDIFKPRDIPFFIIDINKDIPSEHIGVYDGIVSIEVLEHLENTHEFFRKLYFMLKPGGYCFLTTPNIQSIYSRLIFLHSGNFALFNRYLYKDWGHIQIVTAWLLEEIAKKVNFSIIELKGIGEYRYDLLPWHHKIIAGLFSKIKKFFKPEKFEGEFEGSNIFITLKK